MRFATFAALIAVSIPMLTVSAQTPVPLGPAGPLGAAGALPVGGPLGSGIIPGMGPGAMSMDDGYYPDDDEYDYDFGAAGINMADYEIDDGSLDFMEDDEGDDYYSDYDGDYGNYAMIRAPYVPRPNVQIQGALAGAIPGPAF